VNGNEGIEKEGSFARLFLVRGSKGGYGRAEGEKEVGIDRVPL